MNDRTVILLIGVVGMIAATGLALAGHAPTAAIVAPMAMGIINIFLQTKRHSATTEITTSNDGGTVKTTIEGDDTGVIRTLAAGASNHNMPAMTLTESGKVKQ